MMAISKAITTANKLAWYPFIFLIIKAQKIKMIGMTATNADIAMLLKGSITCVQFIILFVEVKTYRLYRAAISKSFIEGIINSTTFPVCLIDKEFPARNN